MILWGDFEAAYKADLSLPQPKKNSDKSNAILEGKN